MNMFSISTPASVTSSSAEQDRETDAIGQLALANRILADQGVVDAFGHVSVRHPEHRDIFLLSTNRAPALVRIADIIQYDLDANPVKETAARHYLERFIHAEIYRARPDVVSVVHNHSVSAIAFGVTKKRLRPIFHMAGFLGAGSSHFEISDEHGDTDLLVRNPSRGRSLANALGACSCVLMRGHGSTVVGSSLQQAVFRAVYAEANAKLQVQAYGLGDIKFLSEAEARLASETIDEQLQRSWALWVQKVGPLEL